METYHNKTFCPHYVRCAKGWNCDKAFTVEVEQNAIKSVLPVSYHLNRPECFEKKGEPCKSVQTE